MLLNRSKTEKQKKRKKYQKKLFIQRIIRTQMLDKLKNKIKVNIHDMKYEFVPLGQKSSFWPVELHPITPS